MLDKVNSSFSVVQRNLQIAWDSTSIEAFKRCERYYQLTIVDAWRSKLGSVHLEFGILVHRGKELFERLRMSGLSHDDCVIRVVREMMILTWDKAKRRPWQTHDSYKNRFTLIRTLVWYFEEYKDDVLKTIRLANGKPAVELSFSFDTPRRTAGGETITICGHLDRLADFNGHTYVADVKTTKHEIDSRFFGQFSPGNQFTVYSMAPGITWHVPVKGVIVDGIQVLVNSNRFGRDTVTRSEPQLQEWLRGFYHLVGRAENCAEQNFWPMNETSCDKYGGCVFRRICNHSPAARIPWLAADFVKQPWDPLQIRSDV
jgi:hypothetical protein